MVLQILLMFDNPAGHALWRLTFALEVGEENPLIRLWFWILKEISLLYQSFSQGFGSTICRVPSYNPQCSYLMRTRGYVLTQVYICLQFTCCSGGFVVFRFEKLQAFWMRVLDIFLKVLLLKHNLHTIYISCRRLLVSFGYIIPTKTC